MNLRKLTRKSIVGFGKYKDSTIQNLLDLKYYSYLRWMYFCNSHINFFDDILDEIKINEDFRIQKPGKDDSKLEEYKLYRQSKMSNLSKLKVKNRAKKLQKFEIKRIEKSTSFANRKGYLRDLNQKK